MTDVTWVLSSCVLILAVIAIRAAFGARMRPWLRYALWGLVLLRLLYPGTVLSSPVSVRGAAEQTEVVRDLEMVRGFDSIEYMNGGSVEGFRRYTFFPEHPVTVAEDVTPERFARMETTIRVRDVLEPVWRLGAAVTAIVFLASNLRFYRALRRRRKPLEADCPLRVYTVEELPSSCLFAGAVYVAAETAADETRLRHVLAHELSHYMHGDHFWALLRCVALALHWYNPLVWWAAFLSRQDSELCADAGALKRLGEGESETYGATLIELSVRRAARASLLCTATTMTNGKKSLRERVTMIARRPRMTAAVVCAVVLIASAAALCAFAGAKAADDAGDTPERYASVEDYLDAVRAQMNAVTYYAADGSGEKTANVLDTRVAFLEKEAEQSRLDPDGTLELYSYGIETKLDVPLAEVSFVGGMYADEDGWCDPEGQGGHVLIVVRRASGSFRVLYDRPRNDDWGGLYYYEDTAEEMLYDWFVREHDFDPLDLPPYTVDLLPDDDERDHLAHRADGDGWYVYVPVQGWYRSDDGDTARWFSQYATGSVLAVRESSAEEMNAERPQLAPGQTERFAADQRGRVWRVWTQYDPESITDYPEIAREPALLEAMAASFTPDSRAEGPQTGSAAETEGNPVAELRAFAQTFYEQHPDVTLTLYDGGMKGSYPGAGTPNAYHVCYELKNATYSRADTDEEPPADGTYLRLETLGCTLEVDGNYVYFRGSDGDVHGFRAVSDYDYLEEALRLWYDEAELRALGGDYGEQESSVVPDRGQGYLAAAQEHCDTLSAASLRVSSGSSFYCTWFKWTVEEAEQQTEHFRNNGSISENTWAIFATEIFVPENETARNRGMAGNTERYDEYVRNYGGEYDPSVPKGAYIRWQCGYVTKEADGYHTELVGTGW